MPGSGTKLDLLLVHGKLENGGAQKYTYNLMKYAAKSGLNVGLLCDRANLYDPECVYLEWVRKLDAAIYPDIRNTRPVLEGRYLGRINRLLLGLPGKIRSTLNKKRNRNTFQRLVSLSDYLILVDYYTYIFYGEYIPTGARFEIQFLCNHQQDRKNFLSRFDPNGRYTITYFNSDQLATLTGYFNPEGVSLHYMPLLLDRSEYPETSDETREESGIVTIGVITRIHINKMIEGFIFAFQSLRKELPEYDLRLKIVGDVKSREYFKRLQQLIWFYRIGNVEFESGEKSTYEILKKHHIDFSWCFTANGALGYSGLDSILHGVVALGLNICESSQVDTRNGADQMQHAYVATDVEELSALTASLLPLGDKYREFLNRQRNAVADWGEQERALVDLMGRISGDQRCGDGVN